MQKRNRNAIRRVVAVTGTLPAFVLCAGVQAAVLERLGEVYSNPNDGMNVPHALAASVDGRQVYVANQGGIGNGGVGVLRVDPTALPINEIGQFLQDLIKDANGNVIEDRLPKMSALAVSADGNSVYGTSEDAVVHFRRSADGKLTIEARYRNANGISGLLEPRALVLSADGARLFVAGSRSNAVVEFSRNASTGALTFVSALTDDVALKDVNSLALSENGAHLYAASSKSGVVALLKKPANSAVWAVAKSYRDNVDAIELMQSPAALALSRDGRNLYVASNNQYLNDDHNSALVALKRDSETGELTFVRAWRDTPATNFELSGIANIMLSADGTRLFGAAPAAGTVSVWRRDPSTGLLRMSEVLRHQTSFADGLDQVSGLASSPDDSTLYTSSLTDSVATYRVRTVKLDATKTFTASDGRALPEVGGITGVKTAESVRLSISLRNDSPIDATAVAISGILPKDAVFIGANGGPELCESVGNAVACGLGDLNANTEKTYHLDFKVTKSGSVDVEWRVVSDQRNTGNTGAPQNLAFYVNTPPQAIADTFDVAPNTESRFDIALGSDNDKDADGDILTLTRAGNNGLSRMGGRVEFNGTTTVILYTPPAGFNGEDDFSYAIVDGHGGESEATVRVRVGAVSQKAASAASGEESSGGRGALDGLLAGLFGLLAAVRLKRFRQVARVN